MTREEALRIVFEQLGYNEGLMEALEQPAQEPVDVARVQEDGYVEWRPDIPDLPVGTKLYTHPAQSWQPMSDEEIEKLANLLGFYEYISTLIEFVRKIEKKILEGI